MRRALNENPRVQMIVLAVFAVVFAIVLYTTALKGSPEPPPAADPAISESAAGDPAASAPAPAPAVEPTPAPSSAAPEPAPSAPAPAPGSGSGADGLLPTKGLPEDVLVAYARNKAIALLVVDPKGMTDRRIEEYTRRLSKRGDVEVFVVPTRRIADYSRITQGVNVSRAPALVAIRPRSRTGAVPTATVSYGFRNAASVEQALEDAMFDGKNVNSFPE